MPQSGRRAGRSGPLRRRPPPPRRRPGTGCPLRSGVDALLPESRVRLPGPGGRRARGRPTRPRPLRPAGRRGRTGHRAHHLGWYHGRLGNHGQALDLCERALVRHQKLGNRPYEAHTWSCLADTRLQLGDPAGAVPCYRQALDVFRELGDPYAEASTLAHLGACHHLAGDHATAGEHWRHARALLRDLDPSTFDQVHAQLTTIDRSAADAFRGRR
ncbi:tetratricopeptide repeat protein [Nonomuraea cypriaca]|uniref:tetratricopeptide repeat protein n=1 Tax=Nonomuraea cypriaca TaxID=1187855 RepID=UPI0038B3D838